MSKDRRGNFFDDFRLGQVFRHGTPRTVTDGDASVYLALTGSRSMASSAITAARLVGLDRRPMDDLLVFNIAFGKTVPDISLNAVANLGYAELRFIEPVFAGDTLRCESEVIGLKENSNGTTGVVWVRSACFDQDGRCVLSWVRWVMVNKSNAASIAHETHVPQLAAMILPDQLQPRTKLSSSADLNAWCQLSGSTDLWDDYEPGESIVHPQGVTIEEADHMGATRLFQNNATVHFDALHQAGSKVGRRLVYGGYVISLCRALSHDGLENVIGISAIEGGTHVAPIVAGDTLYARSQIMDRIEIPGRMDIGALRIRTWGLRDLGPNADLDLAAAAQRDSAERRHVVLQLDHIVTMPRRMR